MVGKSVRNPPREASLGFQLAPIPVSFISFRLVRPRRQKLLRWFFFFFCSVATETFPMFPNWSVRMSAGIQEWEEAKTNTNANHASVCVSHSFYSLAAASTRLA